MMRVLLYHQLYGEGKLKLGIQGKGTYVISLKSHMSFWLIGRHHNCAYRYVKEGSVEAALGKDGRVMASKGLAVLNTPCRYRVQGMGDGD